MKPFKKRRRGGISATFEVGEAHLLANLAGQVVELLRDRNGAEESDADPLAAQLGMGGPSLPPEDPVLQRLLPDAYRDDPEDAGEFRRFTERSLTSAKVLNAETLIGSLVDGGLTFGDLPDDLMGGDGDPVEVELDADEVQAWLRALTDVRLSLAVRLGIETDEDTFLVSQSEDDAIAAMSDIFDWLGYVQETLVAALD
ncbi:DUF2017 domain-containing protein [Aeromicrobium fastidiosum]|uniref:DUF2017 domain-containing protein n=1 Tax=Aeromicrobium fastidiosum TaxID=52699 RepID=A0A641AL01_9ACTN|nr:DUF2017 domain-containing protein [Aeromicrobium fastidiosum]KAA1373634.1 DUF2017 domain-containing protein [Aeromicrobium fastidiosum]MBP2391187.1 hypothetical protein [Aeromicrobium fastidiosum]